MTILSKIFFLFRLQKIWNGGFRGEYNPLVVNVIEAAVKCPIISYIVMIGFAVENFGLMGVDNVWQLLGHRLVVSLEKYERMR